MICQQDVRVLSTEGPYDEWDFAAAEEWAETRELSSDVRRAIGRARQWLLVRQQADGSWAGRTAGDAALESRYVLLSVFLEGEPSDSARRAAKQVIAAQLPGGGWSTHPGGEVDPSVSTLAYFALKLTGHEPSADYMHRARSAILSAGSADAIDIEARCWLAILGQIPYDACCVSPSKRVAPLSIICLRPPVRQIDPRRGIRELFIQRPEDWPRPSDPANAGSSARRGLKRAGRLLRKLCRRCVPQSKSKSLSAARDRILAAIKEVDRQPIEFSSLAWQTIALAALDYHSASAEMRHCQQLLDRLINDDGNRTAVQPCQTPLTDTALALDALHASGIRDADLPIADATAWLLQESFTSPSIRERALALMATSEPAAPKSHSALPPALRLLHASANDHDPQWKSRCATDGGRIDECDSRTRSGCIPRHGGHATPTDLARRKVEALLLAAQNRDGGYSAPHVTALVLQSLGRVGRRAGDPPIDRAIAYLTNCQQADGSWPGPHGADCVQGTARAILALRTAGIPGDDEHLAAGVDWLLAHQRPTGGWGQTPSSRRQPHPRGEGVETIVHTAWAVQALTAADLADHPATLRGVRHLQVQQQPDGAWEETEFTSAGDSPPRFLRNDLHVVCAALSALSRWAVANSPRSLPAVAKR